MTLKPIDKRQGANLPHWTREGGTYFVTFRLADSLPASAIERLRQESALLDRQFKQGGKPMTPEELVRRAQLKSEAYLKLLDENHGECHMRDDRIAEVVASALKHFDGDRYRLWAWCVMPNHVHVVFQPSDEHSLSSILHSWKSFTAKQANKILGRAGVFWQAESYDHLVRGEADFEHAVRYTRENPVAAGLVDWKWVG